MNWIRYVAGSIIAFMLLIGCKKEEFLTIPLIDDLAKADILSVQDVYKSRYSSFTDLIFHNDLYYITFREGNSHGGLNDYGEVVVLKSPDFKNWTEARRLKEQDIDLRDPKLIVLKGVLSVATTGVAYLNDGNQITTKRYNYVFSVDTNGEFETKKVEVDAWPWSFAFLENRNEWYAFSYSTIIGVFKLVKTQDFNNLSTVCDYSKVVSGTEARIRYHKDKMYVIVRTGAHTMLGIAQKNDPCRINWTQVAVNSLGGPNFIVYNDRYLVIGGRDSYDPSVHHIDNKTSVFLLDLQENQISRICILPSSGDTSYPGMTIKKDKLYMSYYTTENSQTFIRSAIVKLNIK